MVGIAYRPLESRDLTWPAGVSEGLFGGHSFPGGNGTIPHYLRGVSVRLGGREKG